MKTLRECIQSGVALLNTKRPGWKAEINVDKFDLKAWCDCGGRACIVVQLFDGFSGGLEALGILVENDAAGAGGAFDHGFDVVHQGRTCNEIEQDYTDAQAIWLEVLAS